MINRLFLPFFSIVTLLTGCFTAIAEDYVRLKDGRLIECAVIRQDTMAVFTTDWASRSLIQPPLQVYSREEVESIWFSKPGKFESSKYKPHPNGWEVGGGLAWQTWAETEVVRRNLLILSVHGGYTVLKQLSFEIDGDFTFPMGGASDSIWDANATGYQTVMNVVAHPYSWRGFVPYVFFGGGAALGVPIDRTVLTSSTDVRNLLDLGVGLKWGSGGLGYKIEWRHHFYEWTPDALTSDSVRVPSQEADASVIRATLFIYR